MECGMSVGPFETLAAVRDFLSREVLPTVPKEMASEVRAAVKLLQDVADELDWLPAVLHAECAEMLALHIKTQEMIATGVDEELRRKIVSPPGSLSEQRELHRAMIETASSVVRKLQAGVREASSGSVESTKLRALLDQHYEILGRHAETRLRWQSVFDKRSEP
jgi:hypothetical protein